MNDPIFQAGVITIVVVVMLMTFFGIYCVARDLRRFLHDRRIL